MNLPPVAIAVFVAITGLLWVGAALLWVQTYRAPENVPVRILALCITLLATTSVLRAADGGEFLSVLVNNVLGVMTAAIQICFFVVVARGRAGVGRMRGELAAAAAVCVLAAVVYLATPDRSTITDGATGVGAVLFSFPVLAYLGYAAGAVVFWTVRILPGVVRRVLRVSLRIVAVGATLQVVGAAMKLTVLLARHVGGPDGLGGQRELELLVGLFVSLGFLTLALGAIVPVTDGVLREIPRMVAQRRARRELEPLWRELQAQFPELVLELRSPGPGRALYRRVVEIRDGLVLLSPYFDARVADRARRHAAGEDGEPWHPAVQAALVRDALDARREGRPAPERVARLVDAPAPDGRPVDVPQDWEDDAARLTLLARHFAAS